MLRRLIVLFAILPAVFAGGRPAAASSAVPRSPLPLPPAASPQLSGGFAQFWQDHNGALLFGAPLTGELQEGGLTVQYLERARLEWHPDYPPGSQITLGRLGAEATQGRSFPAIAAFPSNPGHRYFAATGHSIQGDILRFWEANGGLAIFGYPLSEELTEDGRTVQYFERTRLEHHPELGATGYRVLPTPLGALAVGKRATTAAVVFEPPEVQEGHTVLIKVLPAPGTRLVGGTLGGNTLSFTCCLPLSLPGGAQTLPWAVGGAESYQSPATLGLRLTLQDADGATTQIERTLPVQRYPYPTLRQQYNGPRTNPDVRANEHAVIDAVFAGRDLEPQWQGMFVAPLHRSLVVNAPFGQRRAYNAEPPYEVHTGVDFDASMGTPVYAPAPGRVVFARTLPLRGNTVIVDHGGGVFTLYAHLSAFRATVGQRVRTGDVLALVGSTGNALGPHLHWEVHAAGPAVQPEQWLARSFP